jgi:hypothetical protein
MAAHFRLAVVVVALLACGVVGAGDVYQWKDAKGVTHYSDAPPPKGQYQARDVSHRDIEETTASASASASPAPVTNQNCAQAKINLDRLKTGGDMGLDANGDGQPDAPFSDAERTRQTQMAEAKIRIYCAPTAATATP